AYNSRQKNGSAYYYTNPNAPNDGSCHIFGSGGQVASQLLSSGYIDPSTVPVATSMDSRSFTITMARVHGAGQDNWDVS
ncbi:hypothetical protein NL449_29430, partial [Klebsiella pneumoniae]|nr:hypothetical protein [Klebsiella pneumoniae]